MAIQRTFVSTSGSDSNPGTRESPCRTFQAAVAATTPGGEVVALDSGDYAPFVIEKAVTVAAAQGAYAAINVSSGDGVYVHAGASDAVVLRNLFLTGVGGRHGIFFETGGSLDVEFVTATGFAGRGVRMTAVNAASSLVVRDCVFRANSAGVVVNGSTGGRIRVEIERTRADRNTDNGFWFLGGVKGTVRNAAAAANASSGFFFQPEAVLTVFDSVADGNTNGVTVMNPGTQVQVTLADVVLANNLSIGVMASTASLVRIGSSTITGNGVGISNKDGTVETLQDNLVHGNATDVVGTLTLIATT
jgi:parallel beta helix pectate lyase-like protein